MLLILLKIPKPEKYSPGSDAQENILSLCGNQKSENKSWVKTKGEMFWIFLGFQNLKKQILAGVAGKNIVNLL